MQRVETAAAVTEASGLADLYERHAPAAGRLAYLLTGDRALAEDLVQEAFVRVVGRFRHLRVPDAFEAYLRRTIVNLHTSHLRRRRLERAYLERERGTARPGPTVMPDVGIREELWRALIPMPPSLGVEDAQVVWGIVEGPTDDRVTTLLYDDQGRILNDSFPAGPRITIAEGADPEGRRVGPLPGRNERGIRLGVPVRDGRWRQRLLPDAVRRRLPARRLGKRR